MSAEHPTHPPVLLGDRYRLDELIGSGGMGRVHRAWDTRLGRRVAIKVLSPELAADPAVSARLRAEGQLLAALQHPNLVTLHDIPDDDAVTYLVMELVEGESLGARLRREGPLPAREVSAIITGVAAGLSALHGAGIVHGDVSPANVLLGVDGRARLADLGLAHDQGAAVPAADGLIHGTLRYLAPERLDGSPATPAADVYALASVTYAALVGRPPAVATDVIKLRAALAEPPIRPSLLRPGLAPALDEALLAALGPADGRPDAYHLAVALAQGLRASVDPAPSLASTTVLAAPIGISYRTVQGRTALGRVRRSALALTAGALLLAVGGASLAAVDGLLSRPGLAPDVPLTARAESAEAADGSAAATPVVTVTAAAVRAPATTAARQPETAATTPRVRAADRSLTGDRPTTSARTDTAVDRGTTPATTELAAAAGPAATLRAATLANGLARALADLHTTARDATPRTATIVAVRPAAVIPVTTVRATTVGAEPRVQLPATIATDGAPISVSLGGPISITGGDLELGAGAATGSRAAATTRFASSRVATGTTPVIGRPIATTTVRHATEHADRSGRGDGTASGSGNDDATEQSDRSGPSGRAGREDRRDREDREDKAVREDREDTEDAEDRHGSDAAEHSGKG